MQITVTPLFIILSRLKANEEQEVESS